MPVDTSLPNLSAAPWLAAEATQRVMAAIADGGFEVRAVGGVVRNALLGLPVTDIDMATTAPPDDVMRLARAAGLVVVGTGLKHGTVTVIADHRGYEVTTLRRDVETHGRHATVAFTDSWAEDARRRDFTMNALYCDAAGVVHDPLGGLADVMARRVRFIGEADARIREDYLRILRFFRFTAQYSAGPYDPEGLIACTRGRAGLARLSAERIRQELVRLLVAPGALVAVCRMQEHGILAEVLPAVPHPGLMARIVAIDSALGNAGTAMTRLAALAVEVPEDAQRLAQRLRLSRDERGILSAAATAEARLSTAPSTSRARALLYRLGEAGYRDVIALSWTRALSVSTTDQSWADVLRLPERWQPPRLPIAGDDVMACGVRGGPQVGETLRRIEHWWIEHDFQPDRQALLVELCRLTAT